MKKIILTIILLISSVASISYAGFFDWFNPSVGAPTAGNILRTILPETDSTYNIGSASRRWLGIFSDTATTTNLCFDDNTCMTTASVTGSGTVTSVDLSVPTGFTIADNPITTAGTLALGIDTGYQMLTDVASTTWDNKD